MNYFTTAFTKVLPRSSQSVLAWCSWWILCALGD